MTRTRQPPHVAVAVAIFATGLRVHEIAALCDMHPTNLAPSKPLSPATIEQLVALTVAGETDAIRAIVATRKARGRPPGPPRAKRVAVMVAPERADAVRQFVRGLE